MSSPICRTDDSVLVVVDIQQRLGAAMPSKVLNRVVQNSALLIRAADELQIPMVLTEQYPRGLGPTIPEISCHTPATASRIEKTQFSAMACDAFVSALRQKNRSQVILLGMEAHICVLQTAFGLAGNGHSVFVVEDAICSRRLENYQNALDRMRCGDVNIVSAESVVFEWLGDASHPSFKSIQALLR